MRYNFHMTETINIPRAHLMTQLIPILSRAKEEDATKDGMSKALLMPMIAGFVFFVFLYLMAKAYLLPKSGFGETLMFLLFPILFLVSIAATAFFFRQRITEFFIRTQERFLIRAEALDLIAKEMGVDYSPVPGGPSPTLTAFAKWRYCPQIVKDACALMESHSGFDDVSDIIRASGLAIPKQFLTGKDEDKEKYYTQQINEQQFEDGFRGVRGNIPFAALEWAESHDESVTYHLLIALTLPTQLTGRVEFKTKAAQWPVIPPGMAKKKVGLLSKQFAKSYQVRASDQMEARLIFDPAVIERLTAYSASGPVRGVAFDNHLVVDLEGQNRFDIIDLMSGKWSEESIEATLTDFMQMLGFVDAISNTFSVRPQRSLAV